MIDEAKRVKFGPCCFCGQEIEKSEVDPCRVTVENTKEKWQVWVCHAECFKSMIATETVVDLSPSHF